jgi:MFS family permease
VQAAKGTGYGFGLSTTGAGLVMLPSAVVMLFTGPLSGRLSTLFGPRLPLAIGSVFAGAAYLMLGLAHGQTWLVAVAGLPLGIGIGLAYAAMATLVVAAVKATETGIATGINTIMRSIGGAVGGQIAASLLASHTLRGGVPAETGYTAAFVMSGIAAFVALAICGLIPRVAPERAAPDAEAAPAPARAPEEVAA